MRKIIVESDELKQLFVAYLSLKSNKEDTDIDEYSSLSHFNKQLKVIHESIKVGLDMIENIEEDDILHELFKDHIDDVLFDAILQVEESVPILMYFDKNIELLDIYGSVLVDQE